jgi:hypothetical protein
LDGYLRGLKLLKNWSSPNLDECIAKCYIDNIKQKGDETMFKASVEVEKRGETQENGQMGVTERFNVLIENGKGHIVFSWTDKTREEAEKDIARFNSVKNDTVALKLFVAEIKGRYA